MAVRLKISYNKYLCSDHDNMGKVAWMKLFLSKYTHHFLKNNLNKGALKLHLCENTVMRYYVKLANTIPNNIC